MPKFKVNKYHTVLHSVEVEAADHAAAIATAREQKLNLGEAVDVDEISGFLVDEADDSEFEHSRFYNADGELTREQIEQTGCEVGA